MDLLLRWVMVLLTTPVAIKLSVWIGDGGCFQNISINVWRMGTIYLAVMYSEPSSASAAEDITNLMIWEIARIAPFHSGVGSFSDKNIWAPERLRAVDLWNGPILTIAQIIKFVMFSAAESELGALYITAKEMVPISQTLIEMV